ncbi:4-hydroxy-tetrahydrodipicolinate synthase [Desulfopila sp. IMCC35006]|uniref:4-hydroxy-tetrahydrodipicolinate synthase n=1 Tax=Desulfopila sp. IMCC35006 TaxID=2569542 RepID=UPI00142EA12D|nr:4-hydroxy-tetrahydrodipicolinate synthase [Desulfopila sp. IMCC35006]
MRYTGLFAPLVTPFDANENINYPVLEQLIEFLLAEGVAGFVPGGTTGEVYALSEAERLEIFRFVKEKVRNRAVLIAGTNSGATRDVIGYSQAAETMGYDGLMVAVPPYSRPNQQELLAHYRVVAQSVTIPVILYNFPWRAGTEIGYDVMDELTGVENVVGIKEASGDMSRVYEFHLRYKDRYQMICGSDDQALDYFLWGATCWIGGGASCAPRLHRQVLDAALAGDFLAARDMMSGLLVLLRSLESGSYTQKVKYGCELLGIDVGSPRRPLLPLEEHEKSAFKKLFAALPAMDIR